MSVGTARGERRNRSAERKEGGQGQDRTVDLTIFSRALVPTELPGLSADAVYWRARHSGKIARLDPAPCRGSVGEALAEPDGKGEGQDQASRFHVDDRSLIRPEEVVENPLRKGL